MSSTPDTGAFGEKAFQQFVATDLPLETLEQLTGDHFYAAKHPDETGLMQRVRVAWTKPARDLSCAEVRTLVLQKLGLQWLAPAVIEFVRNYPTADCGVYSGDLTVASLLAWRNLHAADPAGTSSMIKTDFGFLRNDDEASNPQSIIHDGVAALDAAIAELA